MKILGIDEAGRGACIGPLVICGIMCEEEEVKLLQQIGVKDSKKLTKKERERMVPLIKELSEEIWIKEIPPKRIDKENINELCLKEVSEIIKNSSPHLAMIDAPVRRGEEEEYVAKVKKKIKPLKIEIIASPQLDVTSTIVASASIVAKTKRDKTIEELHLNYGNFGSGYPGDEITQKWLKNWYTFSDIVRKKWTPVKKAIIKKGKIMVVGERSEECCVWISTQGVKRGYRVGIVNLDPTITYFTGYCNIGATILTKGVKSFKSLIPQVVELVGEAYPGEKILLPAKRLINNLPKIDMMVINSPKNMKIINQLTKEINPQEVILLSTNKKTLNLEHKRVWEFEKWE
jgi:ribonuclease HII